MHDGPDLNAIAAALAAVDAALARLDAGPYFTDDATGQALADEVVAANPIARRATSA